MYVCVCMCACVYVYVCMCVCVKGSLPLLSLVTDGLMVREHCELLEGT